MSHSTVTVAVQYADTPQEAINQAQEMLEPYSEHLEVPNTVTVPASEAERILVAADDIDLARMTLADVTADPEKRSALAALIGEYTTGNPDHGAYDNETQEYVYRTTANPEGRWDWYSVGGRWRGFYTVKEDVEANACLLGDPGVIGNAPEEITEGRADVARKDSIDIEGMRVLAGMEANHLYDKYETATRGITPPEAWEKAVARTVQTVLVEATQGAVLAGSATTGGSATAQPATSTPAPLTDIDSLTNFEAEQWVDSVMQALHEKSVLIEAEQIKDEIKGLRALYSEHPWITALKDASLLPMFGSPHEMFRVGTGGRDALVKFHEDAALLTHGLLTDEGWFERGRMRMFGMSDDAMSQDEWSWRFNHTIDSLPSDTWLVVMDVHS